MLASQLSYGTPMAALSIHCGVALAMSLNMIDIPVDNLENWAEAAYRGIPPNVVTVENGAIHIDVNQSSSPLIYGFDKPRRLSGFTVLASWSGRLDLPAGEVQGNASADDFVLKFGLVTAGDTRLNWFQRRVAADWILRLHELAPKGSGVNNIRFFSTTRQPELVGVTRTHPLSKLFHEERILHLEETGPFELTRSFDEPVETLGLWISSDGDDTGSAFQVTIHRILLKIVED
jgi:hypothetical protein